MGEPALRPNARHPRWGAQILGDYERVVLATLADALVSLCLIRLGVNSVVALMAGFDAFCLVYLALTWVLIGRRSASATRAWALGHAAPKPRWLRVFNAVFFWGPVTGLGFVASFALAALVTAVFLLPLVARAQTPAAGQALLLSVIAVVGAWFCIHTVYALHYALLHYREDGAAGLRLPDGAPPALFDFAYFALTVGATFATSDIEVWGRPLRRAMLTHVVLSFFFNTTLLALTLQLFFARLE